MKTYSSSPLRRWFKLDRLIPVTTILGSLIAILLSVLNIVELSQIFEELVLSLLGLIAIDTLIERTGILERILNKLEREEVIEPRLFLEEKLLRDKSFKEFISGANELFVTGGSLAGLFRNQIVELETWLNINKKAKLKLILVNPQLVREGKITVESLFRDTNFDEENGRDIYAKDTEDTLKYKVASLYEKFPSNIEVRLTKETPSVTVLMVDQIKARISINLYRVYQSYRPIFEIYKAEHPEWFKTFEDGYYDELWNKSQKYEFVS